MSSVYSSSVKVRVCISDVWWEKTSAAPTQSNHRKRERLCFVNLYFNGLIMKMYLCIYLKCDNVMYQESFQQLTEVNASVVATFCFAALILKDGYHYESSLNPCDMIFSLQMLVKMPLWKASRDAMHTGRFASASLLDWMKACQGHSE